MDELVEEFGLENSVIYDGYNAAIIGVSTEGAIIYDYDKLVEVTLVGFSEGDYTYSDAMEYVDFNIVGCHTSCGVEPIIMYRREINE